MRCAVAGGRLRCPDGITRRINTVSKNHLLSLIYNPLIQAKTLILYSCENLRHITYPAGSRNRPVTTNPDPFPNMDGTLYLPGERLVSYHPTYPEEPNPTSSCTWRSDAASLPGAPGNRIYLFYCQLHQPMKLTRIRIAARQRLQTPILSGLSLPTPG